MIKNNLSRIISILFVLTGLVLIGISIKMKEDNRKLKDNNSCKYEELANKELINYIDTIKKQKEDKSTEEKQLMYHVFKDMEKASTNSNEITFTSDNVTIELKKYKSDKPLIEFSEKYNKAEYGTNKRIINEKNRLVYTVNYLNEDTYNEEIIAILDINDNQKAVLIYRFQNTCVPEEIMNSIVGSIKIEEDEEPVRSGSYITLKNDLITVDIGIDDTKYKNDDNYPSEEDDIYLINDDSESEIELYLLKSDTSYSETKAEVVTEIANEYEMDDIYFETVEVNNKKFDHTNFGYEGKYISYYIYRIDDNNTLVIKTNSSDNEFKVEDFTDIKTTNN